MILFDDSYLVFGKDYVLDEHLIVRNPKLEEIFALGEDQYYKMVSAFVATPSDRKVELFDMGIDFEAIKDFDFFCSTIRNINPKHSKILLGDIDFTKMTVYPHERTQEAILGDGFTMIDELVYKLMVDFIRKINGIPIKSPDKYLNEHVKQYRLEVERNALKAKQRKKKEPFKSMLVPIISALVNYPGSPYTYESIMKITISQLHDSLSRLQKIKNYDNVMSGIYSGSISSKDIDVKNISWLE